MENKKVSILVPVYGVEKYIERCARSLFEQTYDNIEYIFVDDCTKDHSIDILQKILEEYPNRKTQVKILHHEKNRGLSAARNTALDASTGDYLMHVDSDDYLRKSAIDLLVEMISSTGAEVVIFSYNIIQNNKVKAANLFPKSKYSLIIGYLLNREPASMWNKFFDADFYKSTGIRSIEGINQGEDYVVMPRILDKAEKIEWLNECLYYYEQSNAQSYSNNISENSINSMKKADDILFEYFSNTQKISMDYLDVLHSRSALFLIKVGNKDCWNCVYKKYEEYVSDDVRLSLSDRLILFLFRNKLYSLLNLLFELYKKGN